MHGKHLEPDRPFFQNWTLDLMLERLIVFSGTLNRVRGYHPQVPQVYLLNSTIKTITRLKKHKYETIFSPNPEDPKK